MTIADTWYDAPDTVSERQAFYETQASNWRRAFVAKIDSAIRHILQENLPGADYSAQNHHATNEFSVHHLAAEYWAFEHSGLPFRRLSADGLAAKTLYTARQQHAAIDHYQRETMRLHNGKVLLISRFNDFAGKIVGDLPIHGDDGNELTGSALDAAKLALYSGDFCVLARRPWYNLQTDLQGAKLDIPANSLPADLPTLREYYLETLDSDAHARACWITDCTRAIGGIYPANTNQRGALELIELRRQQGRRNIRDAANTATAIGVAYSAAKMLIDLVASAGSPQFVAPTGGVLPLTNGKLAINWTAGTTGYRCKARNPSGVSGGLVVLDPVPDGAFVVSKSRISDTNTEQQIGISASEKTTAPGVYDLILTARNINGPKDLAIQITVPAAAPADDSEE